MIKSIDEYLQQLKRELDGCDPATIQDALSDAEEHLRSASNSALEGRPETSETDVLSSIIEKYGMPDEIAASYREIEARVLPALARTRQQDKQSFIRRFFGVFIDPRAWGSLLYLFFAMITGILYFCWAVTGLSLSLSLIILVIGLPFTGLFLLSVRGIALVEGRIVEALLGVRMPRRPLFSDDNVGWWQRFKSLVIEKHTWLIIVYMVLQFILGTIYFCVFITLIAVALWGIASPILELGFDIPLTDINGVAYFMPVWLMPLAMIAGVLLIVGTMHLAKVVGQKHGELAKALLVRD